MFSWSDTATLDTASPSSPQWSEATSDEPADLGAFGTVFRALSTINTSANASQTHFRTFPAPTPTSSAATNTSPSVPSLSESDGDAANEGTVWAHRPIASYLSPTESGDQPSISPPSVPSTPPPPPLNDDDDDDEEDDEEDELDDDNGTERQQFDELGDEDELPSLGLFDSTLGFIAEERARLAAQRLTTGLNAALDAQGMKRKRRRRRRGRGREDAGQDEDGSPEYDTSTGDALSAPERSQPQTPRSRRKQQHSSSTVTPITAPAVSRPLPVPPSPAVQRLRSLAQKLRGMYPDDAPHLQRVLRDMREPSEPGGFVDVRGPPATPEDPVVHVFVDYSNILIGFISCIKRHPELYPRRGRDDKPRLSHEAMCLVFERGRPTAKRELAASKPLYQPMTTAYQLGFDVHLFQRVPHEDSPSSSATSPSSPSKRRNPQSSDSDFVSGRARWREQGVDECLQLKMYQSVVGPDKPGTIILATGDAAPSQYNSMGFPGTVKSALDRGWAVELYAWENGLSAGWARNFGSYERFKIRGLEEFAELLAAPYLPPPASASMDETSNSNPFSA